MAVILFSVDTQFFCRYADRWRFEATRWYISAKVATTCDAARHMVHAITSPGTQKADTKGLIWSACHHDQEQNWVRQGCHFHESANAKRARLCHDSGAPEQGRVAAQSLPKSLTSAASSRVCFLMRDTMRSCIPTAISTYIDWFTASYGHSVSARPTWSSLWVLLDSQCPHVASAQTRSLSHHQRMNGSMLLHGTRAQQLKGLHDGRTSLPTKALPQS